MTTAITRTLEARYYTDPAIFRAETEGLLSRTWQFVCHTSEVAGAGDYLTFEIAVEEDIRLVESVQRGLKSRGYVPGPLVLDPDCGLNSEHSIATLQKWMREAVDGQAEIGR